MFSQGDRQKSGVRQVIVLEPLRGTLPDQRFVGAQGALTDLRLDGAIRGRWLTQADQG